MIELSMNVGQLALVGALLGFSAGLGLGLVRWLLAVLGDGWPTKKTSVSPFEDYEDRKRP